MYRTLLLQDMTESLQCTTNIKSEVMKRAIRNIAIVLTLIFCSVNSIYAQERPKLKELNAKKQEQAAAGILPAQKKDKWGYVDAEGKFVIPALFHNAMQMCDKQAAFVSFLNEAGAELWTPISINGLYLSEFDFDQVVKDFDDRGLAIVKKEDNYGIITHTGKMVAGTSYKEFKDKGLVYLLYSKGGTCIAVAKDKSEKGYTSYSFAADDPVIVLAEDGKKYLCVEDEVSKGYEDIKVGADNAYFAVKENGKYGVITPNFTPLLMCCQDNVPVIKKDEYTAFEENGNLVYIKVGERMSVAQYDDYLYNRKYADSLPDYLLEQTLAFESKKYVAQVIQKVYGTKGFARIQHLPEANAYAEGRRYILLSNNKENSWYLDISDGTVLGAGEVLFNAFPSATGAPAYASCLRNGKFGVIDIRNKEERLSFKYDKITPITNTYALLQEADAFYLYNVRENVMVTDHSFNDYYLGFLSHGLILIGQDGTDKFYNVNEEKWVLSGVDEFIEVAMLRSNDGNKVPTALVKKNEKYAFYSLVTGEQLTDYLFDDVWEEGFFDGRYVRAEVAGKRGLYDVFAKNFVVPCTYTDVYEGETSPGDELVIVVKDDKAGLYDVKKKALVLQPQYDSVTLKGRYVQMKRGQKYTIYSLDKNAALYNSTPEDWTELMHDGFALRYTDASVGVYDFKNSKWFIEPNFYEMGEFGKDYVWVSATDGSFTELWDYKADKRVFQLECRGNSMPLIEEKELVEGGYMIARIFDMRTSKKTVGLYDLNNGKWVIGYGVDNSKTYAMEYIGQGLFAIKIGNSEEVWIYHVANDAWIWKFAGNLGVEIEDGVLMICDRNDSRRMYMYDQHDKTFVELKDNFTIKDYSDLNVVNNLNDYKVGYSNDNWYLHNTTNQKYVKYPCDRISLMYEQK